MKYEILMDTKAKGEIWKSLMKAPDNSLNGLI